MKYLVAFYSRTGTNKRLGQEIANALAADIDEIIDLTSRKGIIGWLRAGRDAGGQRETEIQVEKNPQHYDMIIVGSPIWNGNLTPAVHKYLASYNLTGKKVAFFAASAGDDQSQVFAQMKELTSGAQHLARFGITQKRVKEGNYEADMKAFLERLK